VVRIKDRLGSDVTDGWGSFHAKEVEGWVCLREDGRGQEDEVERGRKGEDEEGMVWILGEAQGGGASTTNNDKEFFLGAYIGGRNYRS